GKGYLPVGRNLFQREDRDQASLAFVEYDGDLVRLSTYASAVRLNSAVVLLGGLTVAALVASLLVTIAMLPVWLFAAYRKRLAERGGLAVRLVPVAAVLGLVATFAIPLPTVLSGNMAALPALAHPSPTSITVFLASVLFPIFG